MSKKKKTHPEVTETDLTRAETAAVRKYLTALDERAKMGKPRWREPGGRLLELNDLLADPEIDVLKRVALVQERIDIINYITNNDEAAFGMLQQEFVHHAASYGARKNISYAAWRACGVSAPVLTQAGIK